MQRLNLKLVLILAAAGLISVVSVFFVHSMQVQRTAGVLKRQAEEAVENDDLEQAASYYDQYLSYRPNDYEAGSKHAMLMADLAEQSNENRKYSNDALSLLEGALRNDPSRDDIRRRLADFAVYAGRPNDAIEHIRYLLKQTPEDAELLSKLGGCLVRTGRDKEGVETLRLAIEKGGNQIDAYSDLAATLRNRLQNATDADAIIEAMVDSNRGSAKAYLKRSEWLRDTKRPDTEAETKRLVEQINADIEQAYSLAPDDADCIVAEAQRIAVEGDLNKVKELLARGRQLHPKDERMVQLLVEVAIKENRPEDVDKYVESMPDSVALKLRQFDVKIQAMKKDEARAILKELEESTSIEPRNIDYMNARLLVVDGKWLEASRELERLRQTMPSLRVRIDLMLGHCYEVLRQTDKQLEIYREAVDNAPSSVEAHVGFGRALLAIGQHEEALKEFERLKAGVGVENFVKIVVARNALLNLLIDQVGRLPEEQRNWSEVDELMAASKKEFPNANDLMMLDALVLEHKGNAGDARKVLSASLAADDKNLPAWISLINLALDKDGPAEALKVVEKAQAALGDKFELRAMRVSCAAQLPAEEAKTVLAEASQGLETEKLFASEQRKQLRQLIGANYFRLRDFVAARKVFQAISQADPDDQQALLVLFDISINEQDDAKVLEAIAAIKKLLGADSPEVKYVEVRRLIALARAKKLEDVPNVLKEARKKIRQAAQQRPKWSPLARIEAEIDIAENRPDEAIAHLRDSIQFGGADIAVVRQLAELLTLRGRPTEAQQVLAEAQARSASKEVTATSDLIDVSVALSNNDVAKAIALLERARDQDPDDLRKIVWLGQIKGKAARYDEAEALFREAIDKDPNVPTAWQELIKLLRDQQRESDARDVIQLALEKVSPDQRELFAGICCEMLGDAEGAEQHLTKARDEKPNDLGLTRALAMFHSRHKQPEKTRKELDRILAYKPANPADKEQIAWANREVALMIASHGEYSDMKRALDRLNEKDPNDKATMAALLAGRPEAESRIKAVRLLEDVKGSIPLSPDSRLVLAQLYDATGKWTKCKEEMADLIAKLPDDPKYLGSYVEMLIDHDELENANVWMDKLAQLAPGMPMTSAVKAKLLVKQNKPEEAVSVLRDLLPRPMPRDMLPTLLQVAQLLEGLKLNEAAEPMYREYKVLNPQGALVLAGFLGRHGSLKDALDMCESAMETVPRELVLRSALAILRGQQAAATREDFARVEKWISSTSAQSEQNQKSMLLKLIYGELLDMQQRYQELETLYKNLLQSPDIVGQQRAVVLNNLAFLLAIQNRPGESRKWIDEAIQIYGPTSDLLDTRALVEIVQKEPKAAISDLEMAVVDQPSGTKYFHLAQAHLLNKDSQAATDAMKKALETYKLTRKELAPAEGAKFDALLSELGLKETAAP